MSISLSLNKVNSSNDKGKQPVDSPTRSNPIPKGLVAEKLNPNTEAGPSSSPKNRKIKPLKNKADSPEKNTLEIRKQAAAYIENWPNPLKRAIDEKNFDAAIELITHFNIDVATIEEGLTQIEHLKAIKEDSPTELISLLEQSVGKLQTQRWDQKVQAATQIFFETGGLIYLCKDFEKRLHLIALLLSKEGKVEGDKHLLDGTTAEEKTLLEELARKLSLASLATYKYKSPPHVAKAGNLNFIREAAIPKQDKKPLQLANESLVKGFFANGGTRFITANPDSHSKIISAIILNDPEALETLINENGYETAKIVKEKTLLLALSVDVMRTTAGKAAENNKAYTDSTNVRKLLNGLIHEEKKSTDSDSQSQEENGKKSVEVKKIPISSKLFENQDETILPNQNTAIIPLTLEGIIKATELLEMENVNNHLFHALDNKEYEAALTLLEIPTANSILELLDQKIDDILQGDAFTPELLMEFEDCIYNSEDPTYTLPTDILNTLSESYLSDKDKANLRTIFNTFYTILSTELDNDVIDEVRYSHAMKLIDAFNTLGIDTAEEAKTPQQLHNEKQIEIFLKNLPFDLKNLDRDSIRKVIDKLTLTHNNAKQLEHAATTVNTLMKIRNDTNGSIIDPLIKAIMTKAPQAFKPENPQEAGPSHAPATPTKQGKKGGKHAISTTLKDAPAPQPKKSPHSQKTFEFTSPVTRELDTLVNTHSWNQFFQLFNQIDPDTLTEETIKDLSHINLKLSKLKFPREQQQINSLLQLLKRHRINETPNLKYTVEAIKTSRTIRKGALDAPQFTATHPENTVLHAIYYRRYDIALALLRNDFANTSVEEILALAPQQSNQELIKAKYAIKKIKEQKAQNVDLNMLAEHISLIGNQRSQDRDALVSYLTQNKCTFRTQTPPTQEPVWKTDSGLLQLMGKPLPRITRWLHTDETKEGLESIRLFTDKDTDGKEIRKYFHHPIHILKHQRRAHIAPGIEAVLQFEEWENIYWTKKPIIEEGQPRGNSYSMNALLISDNEMRGGTYEFGINDLETPPITFHAYFNTLNRSLKDALIESPPKAPEYKIDSQWSEYGMARFRQVGRDIVVHFKGDSNITHYYIVKPLEDKIKK